jgi:hypothetical protein
MHGHQWLVHDVLPRVSYALMEVMVIDTTTAVTIASAAGLSHVVVHIDTAWAPVQVPGHRASASAERRRAQLAATNTISSSW